MADNDSFDDRDSFGEQSPTSDPWSNPEDAGEFGAEATGGVLDDGAFDGLFNEATPNVSGDTSGESGIPSISGFSDERTDALIVDATGDRTADASAGAGSTSDQSVDREDVLEFLMGRDDDTENPHQSPSVTGDTDVAAAGATDDPWLFPESTNTDFSPPVESPSPDGWSDLGDRSDASEGVLSESGSFAPKDESSVSDPGGHQPASDAVDDSSFAASALDTDSFIGSFSDHTAEQEGSDVFGFSSVAPDADALGAAVMTAVASAGGLAESPPAASAGTVVRPTQSKKKSGGGSLLPAVLGGVLSIPIVIGILWALGKLPNFSRSGGRSGASQSRRLAEGAPSIQTRSLDSLGPTGVQAPRPPSSLDSTEAGQTGEPPLAGLPQDESAADPSEKSSDVSPGGVPSETSLADSQPVTEPVGAGSVDPDDPAMAKNPGNEDDADSVGSPTVPPVTVGLDPAMVAAASIQSDADPVSDDQHPAADSSDSDPFGEPSPMPTMSTSAIAPSMPAIEEPEPLDTLAFDEAAAGAQQALDDLLAVADDDPGRKALLRDWYIALAQVGEEAAKLERVAIERGIPMGASLGSAEHLIAEMVADESVAADMRKVSSIWMRAKSRPSEGIIFPAVMPLEAPRSVGPWWITTLRGSDDPESVVLTVIGREPPSAEAGEQVVVLGVILEGGVIWATECRPFRGVDGSDADEALFGDSLSGDDESSEDAQMQAEPGDPTENPAENSDSTQPEAPAEPGNDTPEKQEPKAPESGEIPSPAEQKKSSPGGDEPKDPEAPAVDAPKADEPSDKGDANASPKDPENEPASQEKPSQPASPTEVDPFTE